MDQTNALLTTLEDLMVREFRGFQQLLSLTKDERSALTNELRLSVEDSPNSAGVGIDATRCCRLALDRGEGGVLYGPSAYFMKHPPRQYADDEAYRLTEAFIQGSWGKKTDERLDSRSDHTQKVVAKV